MNLVIRCLLAMAIPAALAQAQQPPAKPAEGIAAFARAQGVRACLGPLESAEKSLLAGREYAFRAFVDPKAPDAGPFSAIIDSRKAGTRERLLLNLTATPIGVPPTRCAILFEQTQYHAERCEAVLAQMAPNAPASQGPSYGAVIVDVARNLALTLIPAGNGQCVSVVKEVAY